MNEIIAYTDGACSGNPGPGGWGVVLRAESNEEVIKERLLCGGSYETTNNRMELTAAIEALKALNKNHFRLIKQWLDSNPDYMEDDNKQAYFAKIF